MRIHDPIFPEDAALFIIWRRPQYGGRQITVAAGGLTAMLGAWKAVQDEYPGDELTLQNRARILHIRPGNGP